MSPDIYNSMKNVTKYLRLNDTVSLESVVEYTCDEDLFVVPSSTDDTTYRCIDGGNWSYNEIQCLRGF